MASTLLGVLSLALGGGTFAYLNYKVQPFMEPYISACFTGDIASPKGHQFYRTGVQGIDHFLCFITPFFKAVQGDDASNLIGAFLFPAFIAFLILAAIESTRPTARFFVSWFPLVFLFSQLLGVSVVAPAFWLSSYCFFNSKSTAAFNATTVWSAGYIMFGVTVLLLALPHIPSHYFDFYMVLFNFGPFFPSFLWFIVGFIFGFGGKKTDYERGSRAAQAIYLFFAGVVALYWITASLAAVLHGFPLDGLTRIALEPTGKQLAAHFLLVDGAVLFLTQLLWALYVEGVGAVIKIVLMTPFVGPGAAFLLFAAGRESRLIYAVKKD